MARRIAVPAHFPAPKITEVNPKDGLTDVWIQSGKFTMGCSAGDGECFEEEKKIHEVTVTRSFWIGQTDVTQEAYKCVTGRSPSHFQGCEPAGRDPELAGSTTILRGGGRAASNRSRVGVCSPRKQSLQPVRSVGRNRMVSGKIPGKDSCGGAEDAKRIRAIRYARKRVAMDCGLVRGLCGQSSK
jgi:hypothetical protein